MRARAIASIWRSPPESLAACCWRRSPEHRELFELLGEPLVRG